MYGGRMDHLIELTWGKFFSWLSLMEGRDETWNLEYNRLCTRWCVST